MRFVRIVIGLALIWPLNIGWAQVTILNVDFNAGGDVFFNWSPPAGGATSYDIYRATDVSMTGATQIASGLMATNFNDGGVLNSGGPLESPTSFFYRVTDLPSGSASKAFGVYRYPAMWSFADSFFTVPLDQPSGTWTTTSVIKSFLFGAAATIADYTSLSISGGFQYWAYLSGVTLGALSNVQLGGVYQIHAPNPVGYPPLWIAGATVDPPCPIPLPGVNGDPAASPSNRFFTFHGFPFFNDAPNGTAAATYPINACGLITSGFTGGISSTSDVIYGHLWTDYHSYWYDAVGTWSSGGSQSLWAGGVYIISDVTPGPAWTWNYQCGLP